MCCYRPVRTAICACDPGLLLVECFCVPERAALLTYLRQIWGGVVRCAALQSVFPQGAEVNAVPNVARAICSDSRLLSEHFLRARINDDHRAFALCASMGDHVSGAA